VARLITQRTAHTLETLTLAYAAPPLSPPRIALRAPHRPAHGTRAGAAG
jgi:hypothetical protein